MKPLQKRFENFNAPQIAMKKGIYSFYHALESGQDTEVKIKGKNVLMFGSNSYLGLTNHPELIEAATNALHKYGTGASGSRLMNGNLDLHVELEAKLAEFVNKEAATVFSTGFQANIGTISAVVGRNDYIILDEKNHASIIEGSRLTFAKTLKFRHNDMESLEKVLQRLDYEVMKLIIVDGVYSMEGDIAKLDRICDLAKQYNAAIMVDDAHSLGVLGMNGSGTASHYERTDDVDLIMGTFSKSLASLGGFVAGDFATINYIKHKARSLLFSASIPPASAATVLKALEIIKAEPQRRYRLWDNTDYARACLLEENFSIGESNTPIIPIFIGEDIKTYMYSTMLMQEGIYVNPIVHPAVAKGQAILRFSLMATHTREQIDIAVEKLVKCRNIIENDVNPVTLEYEES
ncbi:MAG: aminotransferase class I/II-fold pyridoxal phosphate-dependent enzyme [Bacteroidales bacterium]|nr:aminotransferase class I/II-fold pyridoxal phosphate-dependent enzyme [Bacteroidales bacterium]